MIILGVVLLVVGYVIPIPALVTIGWIVAAIGVVLLLIGVIGSGVGGRRYWY